MGSPAFARSALVALLVAPPPAAGRILEVPSSYPTIEAGLSAAFEPDTVRVACGVYHEQGLTMRNGITLLGDVSDSSCVVMQSTRSNTPILYLGASHATIRGMTFRNGNSYYGGALYGYGSVAPGFDVAHCRFENNQATREGGAIQARYIQLEQCEFIGNSSPLGGAVSCVYAGEIRDCTFRGNRADRYGGATYGFPALIDCTFLGNSAVDRGGAVYNATSVVRCTFEDNQAEFGGGLMSSATVSACTFRGNHASFGGGAYVEGPELSDTVFESNTAVRGAGIYTRGTHATNCTFRQNVASSSGGGVFGYVTAERCLFLANTAGENGGGVFTSGTLSECLFLGNHADGGGGGVQTTGVVERSIVRENTAGSGGGVALGGSGILRSCTLLANGAAQGGGVYSTGSPRLEHVVVQHSAGGGSNAEASDAAPFALNCDFFGNTGGDWTGALADHIGLLGNFSADALFCDESADSLFLSAASPLLAANHDWNVDVGAVGVGCPAEGVIVTSVPPGLSITVDGVEVRGPAGFDWLPGSLHTVSVVDSLDLRPAIRYRFREWSDGGAASHEVVAPAAPATLVARFSRNYFVTVEWDEHGSATPESGWYPLGPLVLTALPDSSWRADGWTGTGIGSISTSGAVASLDLVGPVTERAHFAFAGSYPLTMIADGGGSVSPPGGLYTVNTQVPIRASTPLAHVFDGWTGVGNGSYTGADSVATVRMLGPITQTARFHYAGYGHLTMQAVGECTLSPESGDYIREQVVWIDALPAPGWTFYRWVGEGPGSYTGNERSAYVILGGDVTETAYLVPEGSTFPLTVTGTEGGATSPPSGDFARGSEVTLIATAATGFVFREWQGTGEGSYSGPEPIHAITMHGPVTEHAVFEPDGMPHGYEFSLSASDMDPFANMAPPAGGPRTIHLWLTCSEAGLAAFEAGVAGTLLHGPFHPAPGVVDAGLGTDLLLGVDDCPQGESATRRLGSWDVLDTGGQLWLEVSASHGVFGAVDCGPLPTLWADPWVRGFASAGPGIITGSNACEGTVSIRLSGLTAVAENRVVAVMWSTAATANHAGFHVYRADQDSGPFRRLTSDLLTGSSPHRYEDATADADHVYYYRVGAVEYGGREDLYGPVQVITPKWAPRVTSLAAAVPNPFLGATELRFSLAAAGRAKLAIYDVSGRVVRLLQDGELPVGDHAVRWDGSTATGRAGAGIYFVRFEAGSVHETRRIVFLGAR